MMSSEGIQVVPKVDDAMVPKGRLAHLSDIDGEFMVADPVPDFRGWPVVLPNCREVGKVDDLIVDTDAMVVRYVEVKVDHHVLGTERDAWVLVPIDAARLDERDTRVVIRWLPRTGLTGTWRFDHVLPSLAEERQIRDHYDDRAAGNSGTR